MKKFIVRHHWIGFMLFGSALLLGGCATDGSTQSLKPVCNVLDGPYTYNSKNKDSDYHAGPKLAPRLARHNSIGGNLSCPGF